jgi:hypothetical protein
MKWGTDSRAKVKTLKREIENCRYDVDAPAVADAILHKIRLLKRHDGGTTPISEAGRTPLAPEGPRGR